MPPKKEPITLERIRQYLKRCRTAKKTDHNIEAMEFMLRLIDGEDEKYKGIPTDQLLIEYIERWIGRWSDTPIDKLPFAVKSLDYVLGVLAYERDRHREFMESLGKYISNLTDSATLISKHYNARKNDTGVQYRLSSSRPETPRRNHHKD